MKWLVWLLHAGPLADPGSVKNWFNLAFVTPIFVSNVSADERFGNPNDHTDCPPVRCYDETTRTKLWGVVIMLFNSGPLVLDSPGLLNLQNKGYNTQIWKQDPPLV